MVLLSLEFQLATNVVHGVAVGAVPILALLTGPETVSPHIIANFALVVGLAIMRFVLQSRRLFHIFHAGADHLQGQGFLLVEA